MWWSILTALIIFILLSLLSNLGWGLSIIIGALIGFVANIIFRGKSNK